MDEKPPPSKGLALEPVDFAAPESDAARKESDEPAPAVQPQRSLRIQTADQFLAQATQEYEAGRVEPALWRLAADQGGNDESLVIAAYLRARATALQLQQKRGDAVGASGRKAGPGSGAIKPNVEPEPEYDSLEDDAGHAQGIKPKLKYLAGAVALAVVAGVVWMVAAPRGGDPVPAVATSVPASKQGSPSESELAVVAAQTKQLRPAFEAQVRELKQAGNWNVLVLYASDWTRKEPNNAAAWHELSGAYVKMRQLDDAFRAATNAVQLAPQDVSLWSDLGQINLSLERLPEAREAFDKALSLRDDDANALCGAALVAQRQGRPGDGDALAARVKSVEGGCRGVNGVALVR